MDFETLFKIIGVAYKHFFLLAVLGWWLSASLASVYGKVVLLLQEFYAAASTRYFLYTNGYRPADATWKITTAMVRYYNKMFFPGSQQSVLEIIGYIVVAYYGFVSMKAAFVVLRNRAYNLYAKVQSKADFDTFAEKMMPGSMMESAIQDLPFQAEVWTRFEGGKFYKTGQGFCTAQGFFTALHVVEDVDEVRLVRGEKTVDVPAPSFRSLDADVAVYDMPATVRSQLGISQAKLMPYRTVANSGLLVKVQAFGQRSMGVLRSDDGFGLCSYSGSTVKGFSGAPYCCGKFVYGMHIGGQAVNYGYDAAFLKLLATKGNEETWEWLAKEVRNNPDIDYTPSPYNPDETFVKINGQYHSVANDDLEEWRGKHAKRTPQPKYHMPDYEPESLEINEESDNDSIDSLPIAPRGAMQHEDSKNLIRPNLVSVGANGEASKVPATVLKPVQKFLREISLESRKHLATCLMDGQTPTPAQLSDLLDCTSKSTKKQNRRQRRQRRASLTRS